MAPGSWIILLVAGLSFALPSASAQPIETLSVREGFILRASPFGTEGGMPRQDRRIVDTFRRGDQVFRAHYSSDGPITLLFLERMDTDFQSPLLFRHRLRVGGEERWSGWIPARLEPSTLSHPLFGESTARVAATQEARKEFLDQCERFDLLSDSLQTRDSPAFDWKPGEHFWVYDPNKIKIWAGYLWSFRLGWLMRGYRRPTRSDEWLTPSQYQGSSMPREIEGYYDQFSEDLSKRISPQRSRILSPLDKWGVWLSRRSDRTWWHASAWESVNRFRGGASWAGYCNSSTALPFLWGRPQGAIEDSGVIFEPRDLVGLMQVASYQVEFLFWGDRFRDGLDDEISDPSPDQVVELLRFYLGSEGIPLIIDRDAEVPVWNVLILGAKLTIRETPDPGVRSATLTLEKLEPMDDALAQSERDAVANVPQWDGKTETEELTFKILLNPDGTPRITKWDDVGSHPDFLWVPTGLSDGSPGEKRNPHLPLRRLRELLDRGR